MTDVITMKVQPWYLGIDWKYVMYISKDASSPHFVYLLILCWKNMFFQSCYLFQSKMQPRGIIWMVKCKFHHHRITHYAWLHWNYLTVFNVSVSKLIITFCTYLFLPFVFRSTGLWLLRGRMSVFCQGRTSM